MDYTVRGLGKYQRELVLNNTFISNEFICSDE